MAENVPGLDDRQCECYAVHFQIWLFCLFVLFLSLFLVRIPFKDIFHTNRIMCKKKKMFCSSEVTIEHLSQIREAGWMVKLNTQIKLAAVTVSRYWLLSYYRQAITVFMHNYKFWMWKLNIFREQIFTFVHFFSRSYSDPNVDTKLQ